jgi:hypothetical protein
MDLFERIAAYLNQVGCADVDEIANEMPCVVATANTILRSNASMFWQSHDGMWFVVGKLADAVDTNWHSPNN